MSWRYTARRMWWQGKSIRLISARTGVPVAMIETALFARVPA